MQDRTKIIEKIISAPESLSNSDILAIAEDEELKTLYEGSAMMSAALMDVPDFEVEKSLAQLHGIINHESKESLGQRPIQRFVLKPFVNKAGKKAAVTIGILLTAMAVVAAIFFVPKNETRQTPSVTETLQADEVQDQQTDTPTNEKLRYDNAPLSQILNDVAQRHHCRLEYINTEARDSRYHITIPAEASLQEIAEMLNAFDEVKITVNGNTIIVE